MHIEKCIIYNDSTAQWPMLITNRIPIRIRLAQKSLTYWAQTIYQLSHELCHYAIRQSGMNMGLSLAWFEEPICEAVSLYFLYYCAMNWEQCKLYKINPTFSNGISRYLQEESCKIGTDSLKNCNTHEKLKQYNRIASDDRAGHRNERNLLYNEIIKQPLACSVFCDYQRYIDRSNEVTIRFEDWKQDNPSPMISVLRSIQPI